MAAVSRLGFCGSSKAYGTFAPKALAAIATGGYAAWQSAVTASEWWVVVAVGVSAWV